MSDEIKIKGGMFPRGEPGHLHRQGSVVTLSMPYPFPAYMTRELLDDAQMGHLMDEALAREASDGPANSD